MRSEGELASCDVLSEVVRVYSQCGLVDKGFEVYKDVVEVYECVPNVYACNALLSGLVKCGLLESACEVYDEMLQRNNVSGSGADNYSTCIMVSAFCKKGKVEEGRKLIVDRWGEGCVPNVVFYNILIDGYCKKGDVKKAFLLFKELKLKGFLPAVEAYGAMVNGFCKEGNFGISERLMNEMKSRGLVMNFKVYNSIIDAGVDTKFG
ncbi:pentatricopeptide repeat (PPR) superfamily protein [Artemisia annua]|uniref:Pentatricopeptide repeat (PPR) superfamily protein n=1 Tax=Artemisia annua TaxID=35608 RepID=A0A2U1M7Y2_ARTAN|nr:pentatricopeptide repeat (PPR) superfamily protein [Artemisia annua]